MKFVIPEDWVTEHRLRDKHIHTRADLQAGPPHTPETSPGCRLRGMYTTCTPLGKKRAREMAHLPARVASRA